MVNYRKMIFSIIFIVSTTAVWLYAGGESPFFTQSSEKSSGLRGTITDSLSGTPLPARVVVENQNGEVINSHYNLLPGFFTLEDGSYEIDLMPGEYTVTVYHGIDYLSATKKVRIEPDAVSDISVRLEPWVPLRRLGWVNGDGHAHLYTDVENNEKMLAEVRRICRAQGVDFISTNQGWAGYDENNWRQGYAPFSDDRFLLHYGAEMPKYRTGHTWWLNIKSCHGYFDAAMDTMYENLYYQQESMPRWTFEKCPFVNIPDVALVQRFKQSENAVALVPHPTSWWWQQRGNVKKYTTNVCEYLAFSLLAGGIWDGFVVMGYDRDHYFYQNLWFFILNLGYRLTPVSELDGGFGRNNKFPYGSMRCYYWVGDTMSMENIANAVRSGRTFVTSGPIVFTDIDNQYKIGDTVPADGTERHINIQAYASGENQDFLSYIILFRNGKIYKLWDVRNEKPRRWEQQITIQEKKTAWYAIKVYGKSAWDNPEYLDVFKVCAQIEKGMFKGFVKQENSIALTAPFYFRSGEKKDPAVLQSKIRLSLLHPGNNAPVDNAVVDVFVNAVQTNSYKVKNGTVSFSMPVHAVLKISAKDCPTVFRSLYLDYEPHRRLIQRFANGDWLEENKWNEILQPGQVPWAAFQFQATKDLLQDVQWEIVVQRNERDEVWEKFHSDRF